MVKVQGSNLGVEFTANHPSNHHEFESERAARNPTFQHPTLKMSTPPGTWTSMTRTANQHARTRTRLMVSPFLQLVGFTVQS